MAYLSPFGNSQQSDANGDPLDRGKIYSYLAGTSTPATTYTAEDGLTPQTNPIIMNARGIPANPIWLQGGTSYKLVVTDANDVVLQTVDNVQGINDPATISTQDQWVTFAGTPTYLSATSFSVAGDQANIFQQFRRLLSSNAGGAVYSTIASSTFSAGVTTVVVSNTSGVLDAGMSSVSYGLLSAQNPSVPANYQTVIAGLLYGLTTANNSVDATNDIDFATGQCADSTNSIMLAATTAMTKQLDVAWAAGTGAGGRLSAAAIANTTYHCYVIRRDSDGACDFGFDVSATAPTMPAGYTYFRRVGSILRAAGAIVAFKQSGDYFTRSAAALDVNVVTPGAGAVTRALSVPAGVNVMAFGNIALSVSAVAPAAHLLSDLDIPDQGPTFSGAFSLFVATSTVGGASFQCRTNTSAQIRSRHSNANADTVNVITQGWIDTRGR
jgi:hypothetical protein